MNSIFHRISVRKYQDRPVEKERIVAALSATGETLFKASNTEVTLNGDVFIPIGDLKCRFAYMEE